MALTGQRLRRHLTRQRRGREVPGDALSRTHRYVEGTATVDTDAVFPDRTLPVTFSVKLEIRDAGASGIIFEFGGTTEGVKLALDGSGNVYFAAGNVTASTADGLDDLVDVDAIDAQSIIDAETTISFESIATSSSSYAKIKDSGDGLGGATVGRDLVVSGSGSGNDSTVTVVSVSDGEVEVSGDFTDEAAGSSVTVVQVGHEVQLDLAISPGVGQANLYVNGKLESRQTSDAFQDGVWADDNDGAVGEAHAGSASTNRGAGGTINTAPSGFRFTDDHLRVFMNQLPRQFH